MLLSVTQKQQSFITLNDVLLYINNANQTEKRCIQIALTSRLHSHPVNPARVTPSGKRKPIGNLKFYLLSSFRITSLDRQNRSKVIDLCALANYNVMQVQFIRKSFYYFEMHHKGEKTFYGYDIRTNEID